MSTRDLVKMFSIFVPAWAFMFMLIAYAHDQHQPELDEWYRSLKNVNGTACCDGSDAYSVIDPNWEHNADSDNSDWPYRVKVVYKDGKESDWIKVHKTSVVVARNKAGIAKVWPVFGWQGITITCFMPGSDT